MGEDVRARMCGRGCAGEDVAEEGLEDLQTLVNERLI